jgi:translation initiation factor 2B subunit (eIF-2B alpha/beta/delta family)
MIELETKRKRIQKSFTLCESNANWLKDQAKVNNIKQSEALNQILRAVRNETIQPK